MIRVVILGTGTSIGKTYVTCALARALGRLAPGLPLLPWKLIETGDDPEPDHRRLADLARNVGSRPPLHRFPDPVSPHLAARLVGETLSFPQLVEQVKEAVWDGPGVCLIESAGGAFSPLTDDSINLHLAEALDPAFWILVAPNSLGVLHDLTSTLTAMGAVARRPDAVVLTQSRVRDSASESNAGELVRLGIVRELTVLGVNEEEPLVALASRVLALSPNN